MSFAGGLHVEGHHRQFLVEVGDEGGGGSATRAANAWAAAVAEILLVQRGTFRSIGRQAHGGPGDSRRESLCAALAASSRIASPMNLAPLKSSLAMAAAWAAVPPISDPRVLKTKATLAPRTATVSEGDLEAAAEHVGHAVAVLVPLVNSFDRLRHGRQQCAERWPCWHCRTARSTG